MRRTTRGPLTTFPGCPRVVRIMGASLLLAACNDDAASSRPLAAGDIRTSVTQDLAGKLSSDGRFTLPPAPRERYEQVSPEQASAIAVAWARTFGKYVRNELERIHGKPIDFDALRAGSPAYYAAATYEPVPADVHPGIRNAFGPQYLLYLVDDEGPVISVAVASFNQASVEGGSLVLPSAGGMEIVPNAIPIGQGFAAPVSPEQAASLVSRATGARVSSVPELVMPGRGFHPQHSRWRVTLDRPVSARGSGSATREVYVGLRGQLTVPEGAQPEGTSVFDPPTQRMIPLVRRASNPVSFTRANFPNR